MHGWPAGAVVHSSSCPPLCRLAAWPLQATFPLYLASSPAREGNTHLLEGWRGTRPQLARKHLEDTCWSPVQAACRSQGSDLPAGTPLGRYRVCWPSPGRGPCLWDIWIQREELGSDGWALWAEPGGWSLTTVRAWRPHSREVAGGFCSGRRCCQAHRCPSLLPGCV